MTHSEKSQWLDKQGYSLIDVPDCCLTCEYNFLGKCFHPDLGVDFKDWDNNKLGDVPLLSVSIFGICNSFKREG